MFRTMALVQGTRMIGTSFRAFFELLNERKGLVPLRMDFLVGVQMPKISFFPLVCPSGRHWWSSVCISLQSMAWLLSLPRILGHLCSLAHSLGCSSFREATQHTLGTWVETSLHNGKGVVTRASSVHFFQWMNEWMFYVTIGQRPVCIYFRNTNSASKKKTVIKMKDLCGW